MAGECEPKLRQDFQVWFAIHSTLRPLCASALRSLETRGVPGSSKELSTLEEEGMKFRVSWVRLGYGSAGLDWVDLVEFHCVGLGLSFVWFSLV